MKQVQSAVDAQYNHLTPEEIRQLEVETQFTRKEIRACFARFKAMCVATRELLNAGRSKSSPRKRIVGIRLKGPVGVNSKVFIESLQAHKAQNAIQAQKIFDTANKSHTPYLNWHEYLQAMRLLRMQRDADQVDIFFKVKTGRIRVDASEQRL